MWDKIRSILMVSILVFSGFVMFFNFGVDDGVVEGATLYVGPTSTYKKIQDAVDNASTGDTIYVDNGTYYESVTISTSGIKIIGNSTTDCKIIHHYIGTDIYNYAAGFNISTDNVTITGFNISVSGDYTFGIRFTSFSDNATIINNNITTTGYHGYGIFLELSENNNFIGNFIRTTNSSGIAFFLYYSSYNDIIDNTINASGFGDSIFVRAYSNYNNIADNKINATNVSGRGIKLDLCSHNIVTSNIINTYSGTGISLEDASNNNITRNIINANGTGIYLWSYSNKNNITGNIINTTGQLYHDGIKFGQYSNYNNCTNNMINTTGDHGYGISFSRSSNNNIKRNTINTSGQEGYGIRFYQFSNYNNLTSNTIKTSGQEGYGIFMKALFLNQVSNNNNITDNTITTSGLDGYGIYFEQFSKNNNMTGNMINTFGQRGYGIFLDQSSNNNNITANTINTSGQNGYGIYLDDASNHNNLTGNTINTSEQYGYGIYLEDASNYNNLTGNTINTTGFRGSGVALRTSLKNNLTGNTINTTGDLGSGIRLMQYSNNNNLTGTKIYTSGDVGFGFYISDSNNNNLTDNEIYTLGSDGHGIYLSKSNGINITNNTVVTKQSNSEGISTYISNNTYIKNSDISTSGSNADGIDLYDMNATVEDSLISSSNGNDFNIQNDGNITALNCSFNTVETAGGVLIVKNYLSIQAYYNDSFTPIPNADVVLEDNSQVIYNSVGYGGTDPQTDTNGRIGKVLIMDRWYYYSNIANENLTNISVKKTKDLSWEEVRKDVNMNSSHTELFISSNIIAPTTPSGLMVSRVPDTNNLTISWDPNPEVDIINYTIYTNKTGQWSILANITHPLNSTLDIDLLDETWYFYRIQAWDTVNLQSGISVPVGYYLADILPPTIPKGFDASSVPIGDAMNITWNLNVDDTVKYELWWRSSESSAWVKLGNFTNTTSWFVWGNDNLVNGTNHHFRLRAWDELNNPSNFTNIINVTHSDNESPDVPTNLMSNPISDTRIDLSWIASTATDVEEYGIYFNHPTSGKGGPYEKLTTVDAQTLNYQVTGLSENVTYYFVVVAIDEGENPSGNSNEANSTTIAVPPSKPILNQLPKITNIVDWNVTGTTELGTKVFIFNNGNEVANGTSNATGVFGIDVKLIEGINKIHAKAMDQANLWSLPSLFQIGVLNTTNPVADAGIHNNISTDSTHKFDGTNSTDDDKIDNYTWTFVYDGKNITLYGPEPEFKFNIVDTYTVTLTVTDNAGNKDKDTTTVHVSEALEKDTVAPDADAGTDKNNLTGHNVKFDGSGSKDNIGISNYTWKFTYNGKEMVLYGMSPSFQFLIEGEYKVTLTVIDFEIPPNKDVDIMWVNVTESIVDEDTDDDGMLDSWEDLHGFNKSDPNDAALDADDDDLTNLNEYMKQTDPHNPDSDGDGLTDGWEVDAKIDPLDDGSTDKVNGPDGDPDGDGFTNLEEFEANTDPQDPKDKPEEDEPQNNFMLIAIIIIIIIIVLLLIGMAMRKKKPAEEEEEEDEEEEEGEEEIECAECGAMVPGIEIVCPECGAQLPEKEDEEPIEDELDEEEPMDEELDEEELEEDELEEDEMEE